MDEDGGLLFPRRKEKQKGQLENAPVAGFSANWFNACPRSRARSARKTCPWAGFQRRAGRKAPGKASEAGRAVREAHR